MHIVPERIPSDEYPFHLPRIRTLDLRFDSAVTFFVGENGTGKSTVMEAIAALQLPDEIDQPKDGFATADGRFANESSTSILRE